jgi:hypothetical protein
MNNKMIFRFLEKLNIKSMNTRAGIFFCLILLNLPVYSFTQTSPGDAKEITEQVFAARKLSQSLVIEYTWNCRTEVTRDGKIMDILIDQVRSAPNGQLQYIVMNDQGAKLPTAFIIHKIAEDEKNKLVDFLHGMKSFLERYSMPAEPEILDFMKRAKAEPVPAENMILLKGEDVIQAGDQLSWWVDKTRYTTEKIMVATRFEGEQVNFTATFKTLPDGLNYMAFAEASIPGKNLVLQLQNYDYVKTGIATSK